MFGLSSARLASKTAAKHRTLSLWLEPLRRSTKNTLPTYCVSRGRFLRRHPVDLLLECFLGIAAPFQNLLAVLNHLRMTTKIGDAVLAVSLPDIGILS